MKNSFTGLVANILISKVQHWYWLRRGPGLAALTGDVWFQGGYRLAVYEILTWDLGTVSIQSYSYELWKAGQKMYWYDPQPHPNEPSLASTHPHHKHIPPNPKHHRIPAPGLGFNAPNLPFLIREIQDRGQKETQKCV